MNKSELYTELQGKRFVLYKGLLSLSHEKGMQGIDTKILDLDHGKGYCVVHATVTGPDGQTYTGIGDADQTNVNRMISRHFIRMAETRAKARAMRDFCNIGETAFEELGENNSPTHRDKSAEAKIFMEQLKKMMIDNGLDPAETKQKIIEGFTRQGDDKVPSIIDLVTNDYSLRIIENNILNGVYLDREPGIWEELRDKGVNKG